MLSRSTTPLLKSIAWRLSDENNQESGASLLAFKLYTSKPRGIYIPREAPFPHSKRDGTGLFGAPSLKTWWLIWWRWIALLTYFSRNMQGCAETSAPWISCTTMMRLGGETAWFRIYMNIHDPRPRCARRRIARTPYISEGRYLTSLVVRRVLSCLWIRLPPPPKFPIDHENPGIPSPTTPQPLELQAL
jgi:hypothetical protein